MGGRSAAANPCSDLPGFCPAVSSARRRAEVRLSDQHRHATGTLDALHDRERCKPHASGGGGTDPRIRWSSGDGGGAILAVWLDFEQEFSDRRPDGLRAIASA